MPINNEIRKMQRAMTTAWKVNGLIPATTFHTTLDGPMWVALFGPDFAVRVKQHQGRWFCKKQWALEHIGTGKTPLEAMLQGWRWYQAQRCQTIANCKDRLVKAADELDRQYAAAAEFDRKHGVKPKGEFTKWNPADEVRKAGLDRQGRP